MELADALNDVLSGKWRNLRGLEIVSFGVSSVKASEEDEQMLKEMQRNAAFMDPTRAAAHLVGAQASAMQAAAQQSGRRPRDGVHGHEHGRTDGRHERAESLPDGSRSNRLSSPHRHPHLPRTCERLDVQLRTKRHQRQFLPELRQQKAGTQAGGRKLEMPAVRRDGKRKVLPRMRHKEAGSCRQMAGRAAAAR